MALDPSLSRRLRLAANVLILLGLALALVQLGAAFVRRPGPGLSLDLLLRHILPALAYLGGGIGLGLLLQALASQPAAGPEQPAGPPAATPDSLLSTLADLDRSVENLWIELREIKARLAADPHPDKAAPADPAHLARLAAAIHELRELVLLNDQQKQERLAHANQARKREGLAKASAFIQQQHWAQAEHALAALEADDANDPDVAALRRHLQVARSAIEHTALDEASARIEDLMAISSWDQALAEATKLASNFPSNPEAQRLLARVTRERDLFREGTVQRLYEEIKADIEHRRWRKALAGAQRLLERFPEHRRTEKIRGQIRTIQDNAEIEERQEAEQRIQELIRSKRYAEALELAEDLVERFPTSPQAQTLRDQLPRLRTMAVEEDATKF